MESLEKKADFVPHVLSAGLKVRKELNGYFFYQRLPIEIKTLQKPGPGTIMKKRQHPCPPPLYQKWYDPKNLVRAARSAAPGTVSYHLDTEGGGMDVAFSS